MNLSFRYEKAMGFCRVCGLLEHRLGGCEGPPDTYGVQVLGGSTLTSMGCGVPPGFGGGTHVQGETSGSKKVVNPNPS